MNGKPLALCFFAASLTFSSCSICFAAIHNLDETMARKARHATANFYSGEEAPYYQWQPETLHYTDATTGKEVWRLAFKPLATIYVGKEHGLDGVWNANGARVGLKNVPGTDRPSVPVDSGYDWIFNSDGSKPRKSTAGARMQNGSYGGFGWAQTNPDLLYRFRSEGANGMYKGDQLWKYTVDAENGISSSTLIRDLNNGYLIDGSIKNGITGNDKYFVGFSDKQTCSDCPNQSVAATSFLYWINLSTGAIDKSWGVARGCGPSADPYGDHTATAETTAHAGALWALGPSGDDIVIQYSTGGNFWQLAKNGHHTDGGPAWEDWDGDSFGVNEDIKIISDGTGTPDNPYGNAYWGHPAFDKWGTKAIVGDYSDTNKGTRIVERSSNWNAKTGHVANAGAYDNGHHNWAAWSDWVVANETGGDLIFTNIYSASDSNPVAIADVKRPPMSVQYPALPRPVQSPDGTKVAFHTVMFHSDYDGDDDDDDYISVAVAVAYYPHPPEITSVTNNSGTYTVRFDWRTDQTTSRGYTQRGWPDEAVDDPPPPRETKLFRLWRSANGSTEWEPVGTVDADIFGRYNFATGEWNGNKYWEIADTPKPGTWYYAVTAQEWSGLESHTLSNVFSTAGTQTAIYPSDPKGTKKFYSFAPQWPTPKVTKLSTPGQYRLEWDEPEDPLIRYYNIYYSTNPIPKAIQNQRIASVPRGTKTYVDWLADPAMEGYYLITSVDTQGNESSFAKRKIGP